MSLLKFGTLLLCSLLFTEVQCSVKRGVVHTVQDYVCGDFFAIFPESTWWYDYTPNLDFFLSKVGQHGCSSITDVEVFAEVKHIPMVWGTEWEIPNFDPNALYVLGYNEPNHMKQSDLPASAAALHWPNVVEKAGEKSLVCPSPAPCGQYCHTYTSQDWFDEFFQVCNTLYSSPDCACDYIATHIYKCEIDEVMKYLDELFLAYGMQIWLTEFSCSRIKDPKVMLIYMKKLLPLLEETSYVYRYSWYKARQKPPESNGTAFLTDAISLLEPNSPTRTELGEFYFAYEGGPVSIDISIEYFGEAPTPLYNRLGVFKEEVMVVLHNYIYKPSDWYLILGAISANLVDLPSSAQAFYITASKVDRKIRIRTFFQELMCLSQEEINDVEIWNEVVRITNMPETQYDTKQGRLKVPIC